MVSDADGRISTAQLSVGHYTLIETKSADGYILNTEQRQFEIPESTELDEVIINLESFINYQGSVKLTKTDNHDTVLPNVVFNLLDADGNIVFEKLVTDSQGQIFIENLAPGHYAFKEVQAADGYIINESLVEFEIEAEAMGEPNPVEVSKVNSKGSMEMIKTDELGNPLEGAQFELRSEQDDHVQTLVSDENGRIFADELAPGAYSLHEVKAPEGFVRNTEIRSFEIVAQTNLDRVHVELQNFINYRGTLKVSKVDEVGDLIHEATFEIRDALNNVVSTFETNDGIANINNLNPGIYTLHETIAPNGYERSTQAVVFEITSEFEGKPNTVSIDFINKKIEEPEIDETEGQTPENEVEVPEVLGTNRPYLPATGMSNTPIYIAAGLVVVGAILLVIRKKKQEK